MQLVGAREGRQAEARGGGVLEVGAGVREEDEGHGGFVVHSRKRFAAHRGQLDMNRLVWKMEMEMRWKAVLVV